jgi:hypothetical protein
MELANLIMLMKCYFRDIAYYVTEHWALRKVNQKNFERCILCCWRRMEKILWTFLAKNEDVFQIDREESNILHLTNIRKWRGLHCAKVLSFQKGY